MFCRLCGKISGGGKCIYCGSAGGARSSYATRQSAARDTAPAANEDYLSAYYAEQNKASTPKPLNGAAVASFVTAFFVALFIVSFILGIVGIKKAKTLGSGKGFAIAGIVLSIIVFVELIALVVQLVIL